MKRTRVLSALAAALVATSAFADTLTWKTGVTSGSFSGAANWTSDGTHTTPQPGDTVTFNSDESVTLTAESFDLGDQALTFDVANEKTVTVNVLFSGAGSLVKTGAGTLNLKSSRNTHSGGITVLNGVLSAEGYADRADPAANCLGTGPLTVARASGRTPCLKLAVNNGVVTNAINITGPFNAEAMDWNVEKAEICTGNNPNYYGPITSEGSFRIANSWAWASGYNYSSPILGPVTVTDGGTLYAHRSTWFANTQNCSVVVHRMDAAYAYEDKNTGITHYKSGGIYFANGYRNENPDAVITNAISGHLQFNGGSWFAGREVVAKGATVTNVLNGASCFGDDTVVKLLDGAQLQVGASFARVPRLFVGEEELPAGLYTAANFPGTFLGSGVLCVGLTVSTWTGGTVGSWTDADNWDNGVPCDGHVAVFNSVATNNEGVVEIGAGGLAVICNADVTVNSNATFTGVGKLMKAGAKTLALQNYLVPNSYAGGTDIFGGPLQVAGDNYDGKIFKNELGTGLVKIWRTAGGDSRLSLGKWMALTNEVSVVGPWTAGTLSITCGNTGGVTGRITATDDIGIGNSYAWSGVRSVVSNITAHAHTVRFPILGPYAYSLAFVGTVDASLEINSDKADGQQFVVETEGRFVDPDATYSVLGGSNVVASTASIACTNVVVGSSSRVATLVLQKGASLNSAAKVTIQGTGRLSVASGSKVKVAELWAPGDDGTTLVKQPVGNYSSAGVPAGATVTAASFLGTGRLRVGEFGQVLVVR